MAQKKYFLDFLFMKIGKLSVDQTPLILSTFDLHGYDLLKKVKNCYCCIRLKHHAKFKKFGNQEKTSEEKSLRLI